MNPAVFHSQEKEIMKEIMDNGPVQGMVYGCGIVRMIRWSCTVHLLALGIPEMP